MHPPASGPLANRYRIGPTQCAGPLALAEMLQSEDAAAVERITAAFLNMEKQEIALLEKARRG